MVEKQIEDLYTKHNALLTQVYKCQNEIIEELSNYKAENSRNSERDFHIFESLKKLEISLSSSIEGHNKQFKEHTKEEMEKYESIFKAVRRVEMWLLAGGFATVIIFTLQKLGILTIAVGG